MEKDEGYYKRVISIVDVPDNGMQLTGDQLIGDALRDMLNE